MITYSPVGASELAPEGGGGDVALQYYPLPVRPTEDEYYLATENGNGDGNGNGNGARKGPPGGWIPWIAGGTAIAALLMFYPRR